MEGRGREKERRKRTSMHAAGFHVWNIRVFKFSELMSREKTVGS